MNIRGRDPHVMDACSEIGRNMAGPEMKVPGILDDIAGIFGLRCCRTKLADAEHPEAHGIPEYVSLKPLSIRIADACVSLCVEFLLAIKLTGYL